MKHIEKIPSMCNCAFWTFPLRRRMTHFVSLQNFQGQSLKVPKQKHLKVLRLFNLGEVNGIPIPRTPNFEWSWEIGFKMEGVYLNWLNWRFPLWSRRGQACLQQLRKLQRQNAYSLNVCWILGTSRASSLKVGVLRVWNFNVAAMFRGRWGRLTKMDHVGVPWNESTKQVCFAIWDCCWVSKAFGAPVSLAYMSEFRCQLLLCRCWLFRWCFDVHNLYDDCDGAE